MKLRADTFGALAHSGQPPVSVATRLQYRRIDPAAIISNQDTKAAAGIFHCYLDAAAV